MGLAVATGAQAFTALPITFDPQGNGAASYQVTTFDWNVGNAVGIGSVPLSTSSSSPTLFDFYYQAAISQLNDGNGNGVYSYLGQTGQLTLVMGFGEQGYLTTGPTSQTANFSLDTTNPLNYFEVWYHGDKLTDALAGTGYANDVTPANDQLILWGTVVGNNTSFTINLPPTIANLDQVGTNDYAGVGTVVGTGSGSVDVVVDGADADFFKDYPGYLTFDLNFTTTNLTPFNQVNPSQQIYNGAGGYVTPVFSPDILGIPGIDFINGGPVAPGDTNEYDFQFQADASMSGQYTTVVPEPGTMLLLGSGLLGLAGLGRRREKK